MYCVDDIAGKVDYLLQIAPGDAEHHCQARRYCAEEPDVRHRDREVHVAHALAADNRARNLDAALLADDTLIAYAAVFAAVALVVAVGAEDLFVEQRGLFRTLGAVVDGLGLGDLAVRPLEDTLGARGADAHRVKLRYLGARRFAAGAH